jgi:hypothetical protein
MPDQLWLPTEEELKRLPLRAFVAYSARCARRLQPLFGCLRNTADFAEHEAAIEAAISIAEKFCRGEVGYASFAADDAALAIALDAARAANQAYAAACAAAHAATINANIAASSAAFAVDSVAYASVLAAVLAASADISDITAAYIARAAAFYTVDSADSNAARSDFDALLSMNLGELPEFGPPIDPSEDGPLGPLWPDGVPEWFTTPVV